MKTSTVFTEHPKYILNGYVKATYSHLFRSLTLQYKNTERTVSVVQKPSAKIWKLTKTQFVVPNIDAFETYLINASDIQRALLTN